MSAKRLRKCASGECLCEEDGMKTVCIETARRLKAAGWYQQTDGKTPSLEEILAELSYRDLSDYWAAEVTGSIDLPEWLYNVFHDVEKAAEVWIKVKGKKK